MMNRINLPFSENNSFYWYNPVFSPTREDYIRVFAFHS